MPTYVAEIYYSRRILVTVEADNADDAQHEIESMSAEHLEMHLTKELDNHRWIDGIEEDR